MCSLARQRVLTDSTESISIADHSHHVALGIAGHLHVWPDVSILLVAVTRIGVEGEGRVEVVEGGDWAERDRDGGKGYVGKVAKCYPEAEGY